MTVLDPEYYRSLSLELRGLKNRVRSFIRDRHWLTDGEWKESVLRSMLRRHLPRTVEVGRGFVVAPHGTSTQIDVLLHDTDKPILFRDGDLVFVTPDAVRGVIEVKTRINDRTELESALTRICDVSQLIRAQVGKEQFFGLFAYEDGPRAETVLDAIKAAVRDEALHEVHCVCLGERQLVRSVFLNVFERNEFGYKWRAYDLDHEGPGYFLHNVIEGVSPQSVRENASVWFPPEGKEARCVAETTWR